MHYHTGASDNFFCTKYIKAGSFEEVIAFRGTDPGRTSDLAVDLQHLLARHSSYITRARNFLGSHGGRNTFVTGHSLGGFIAISMAFHFSVKVVAFNPPWVMGHLPAFIDQARASTSPHFRNSKIIVYQSSTDVVTAATHAHRIQAPNLRFIYIGAIGWHDIDSIVRHFSRTSRYTTPLRL